MALEIFKLVGSIMVDNTKANESLSKTDDKAKGIGQRLASGIGTQMGSGPRRRCRCRSRRPLWRGDQIRRNR